MSITNLVFIQIDQLNSKISSLINFNKTTDAVLFIETKDMHTNVPHHKLKIAFQLICYRKFSKKLKDSGAKVYHTLLDQKENSHSIYKEIIKSIKKIKPVKLVYTESSDWKMEKILEKVNRELKIECISKIDDRFYCDRQYFKEFSGDKKSIRMETFYREIRKKYNILLTKQGKPIGGKWNFDSSNRKKIKNEKSIPPHKKIKIDALSSKILSLVEKVYPDNPGDTKNFNFATTREQAISILKEFIKNRLKNFGEYQDAMLLNKPWLFHGHLSFYINNGLLLPSEVVGAALEAYNSGKAPLNSVEGFVRQIIGWREFIRGVYWLKMPKYESSNFFDAKSELPNMFWTAKTDMTCMAQCIGDTLNNAYAHHIQRLMVLGNFAMLASVKPKQVQDWYLAVYADAYEWVEMPNVIGMILHADGGFLASKPYIASGNYINKMSNYCESCKFNVKDKYTEDACPFNYLYWNWILSNKKYVKKNPRMSFQNRQLLNFSPEELKLITKNSKQFLSKIKNDKE